MVIRRLDLCEGIANVLTLLGQQRGLIVRCGYGAKTVEANRVYRPVQIDTTCELPRAFGIVSVAHDSVSVRFLL